MFETPPVPPEEEPVTSRDEADEPSGEEDPQNEQEQLEEFRSARRGGLEVLEGDDDDQQ